MNTTVSEFLLKLRLTPVDDTLTWRRLSNGHFLAGYLLHDEDCINPCISNDGVGMVYPIIRGKVNQIERDEALEYLKDPMVVQLSYYEHGLCLWDVQGGNRFESCSDKEWDGTTFAGVWVPDYCCRDEIKRRFRLWKKENNLSKTTEEQRKKQYQQIAITLAEECCEEFTEWCNGNCFGLSIEEYTSEGEFLKKQETGCGYIGSVKNVKKEMDNIFENCYSYLNKSLKE